ncbi:MAG: hypothetical protein FWF00_01220 [Endomicrobia bacterium]|nr:hypothetical protein [Endomicrobiia bacterium]MCL2506295.1 hypothetical protein [Endomicrobiia bacterium]
MRNNNLKDNPSPCPLPQGARETATKGESFETAFLNRFPKFGVNKSREIIRLIFETAKRDGLSPEAILSSIKETDYESVKNALLKRRYPQTFQKTSLNSFYLPKYDINPELKADNTNRNFYPKNIYFEKEAQNSFVYDNLESLFPSAVFTEILSLKDFMRNLRVGIKGYNNRNDNLFLVKEKYDFFKKCPCTSGVVNCGYSIMNLGMGCPYECSYCFLQGYQNIPGIVIPYNIDDYLTEEKIVSNTKGFFDYKRIGSGEFTDSLVFDHITGFSKQITDFFKKHNDIMFEFKTKSVNIKNLIESGGQENIVAAWSVNSLKMAEENEFKAASMHERLNAAKKCADAGFSTAFHFDPVIFYDDWKNGYKETVDMIFDTVPEKSIKWISIGTLRMPAAQKTVIENRFPENSLLDGELILGQDYKLRYHKDLRIEMYKTIIEAIKSKKTKTAVYLCMEEKEVWKETINN